MINQPDSFIYSITCPESKQVIYIGRTTRYKERIKIHLYSRTKTPISQKIDQIVKNGNKPQFDIIDKFEQGNFSIDHYFDHCKKMERFYIELFKSWGISLLNRHLILKTRLYKKPIRFKKALKDSTNQTILNCFNKWHKTGINITEACYMASEELKNKGIKVNSSPVYSKVKKSIKNTLS